MHAAVQGSHRAVDRPPAKQGAGATINSTALVLTCVHVMGGILLPTTEGFSVSVTFLLPAGGQAREARGGQAGSGQAWPARLAPMLLMPTTLACCCHAR